MVMGRRAGRLDLVAVTGGEDCALDPQPVSAECRSRASFWFTPFHRFHVISGNAALFLTPGLETH